MTLKNPSRSLETLKRLLFERLTLAAVSMFLAGLSLFSIPASPIEAQDFEIPVLEEEPRFPLPHLRWVGILTDLPTNGLWLEFFPDTMVLVNTSRATPTAHDYRITEDSIIVTGDTVFRVRYELVLDRMLFYTADGSIVTMSPQSELGRPFTGNWLGVFQADTLSTTILLRVFANGNATWKELPDGETHLGEWNRNVRTFRFDWGVDSTVTEAEEEAIEETAELTIVTDSIPADSLEVDDPDVWIGYHDPFGNAMQFRRTIPGSGSMIFRKIFR